MEFPDWMGLRGVGCREFWLNVVLGSWKGDSVLVGWLALVADCRVLLYQIARLHSIKCKDFYIGCGPRVCTCKRSI